MSNRSFLRIRNGIGFVTSSSYTGGENLALGRRRCCRPLRTALQRGVARGGGHRTRSGHRAGHRMATPLVERCARRLAWNRRNAVRSDNFTIAFLDLSSSTRLYLSSDGEFTRRKICRRTRSSRPHREKSGRSTGEPRLLLFGNLSSIMRLLLYSYGRFNKPKMCQDRGVSREVYVRRGRK